MAFGVNPNLQKLLENIKTSSRTSIQTPEEREATISQPAPTEEAPKFATLRDQLEYAGIWEELTAKPKSTPTFFSEQTLKDLWLKDAVKTMIFRRHGDFWETGQARPQGTQGDPSTRISPGYQDLLGRPQVTPFGGKQTKTGMSIGESLKATATMASTMALQAIGGVLAGLNVFSEGSGIHLAKLSSFIFNKPLTGAEGEAGYRDKTFAENALKISKGRTSDKSQLGFAEKLWLVGETLGDIFWHSQDDWKNYREAPIKYQYFWEAPWMALELMIPGAAILKSAKALSKTEGTGLLAKLSRNVAAPVVKGVGKVETAQEAILPGAFKLLGGATKATAKATKKVTNVSWEKLAQISGVTNKVLKNVTDQFSDLRPLDEVVAYATKKDAARVLGNIVPPLRNFIVGASGQTQTPIHKLNTALNHRASEISAKADLRVRKLEQKGSLKKVFGLDADNRINLPNIKEHPTFFDVANNPKGHKKVIDQMTDAQKSTLLQFQKEYSNITAFLSDNGVEVPTENWIGKRVAWAKDANGEIVYATLRHDFGSAQDIFKARVFESMEDALAAGFHYIDPATALRLDIEAAYNLVSRGETYDYIRKVLQWRPESHADALNEQLGEVWKVWSLLGKARVSSKIERFTPRVPHQNIRDYSKTDIAFGLSMPEKSRNRITQELKEAVQDKLDEIPDELYNELNFKGVLVYPSIGRPRADVHEGYLRLIIPEKTEKTYEALVESINLGGAVAEGLIQKTIRENNIVALRSLVKKYGSKETYKVFTEKKIVIGTTASGKKVKGVKGAELSELGFAALRLKQTGQVPYTKIPALKKIKDDLAKAFKTELHGRKAEVARQRKELFQKAHEAAPEIAVPTTKLRFDGLKVRSGKTSRQLPTIDGLLTRMLQQNVDGVTAKGVDITPALRSLRAAGLNDEANTLLLLDIAIKKTRGPRTKAAVESSKLASQAAFKELTEMMGKHGDLIDKELANSDAIIPEMIETFRNRLADLALQFEGTHKKLKQDIKLLKEKTKQTPFTSHEFTHKHPLVRGMIIDGQSVKYEKELKAALDKLPGNVLVSREPPGVLTHILRGINAVNNVGRVMALAGDMSVALIQMITGPFLNPKGYAKSIYRGFKSMVKPETYDGLFDEKTVALYNKYGMEPLRNDLEATRAFQKGELFGKPGVGENPIKSTVLKYTTRPIGAVLSPFQRGYETALESYRRALLFSYDEMATKAVGRELTGEEINDIGSLINALVGTVNTKKLGLMGTQELAESAFILAPKYTRSLGVLLASGIRGSKISKELAINSILRTTAGLMGVSTALSFAQEYDPDDPDWERKVLEHLNPASSQFMTWEVYGQKVGFGTKMRSTIKFLGDVIENPSSLAIGFGDAWMENPALRYLRSMLSPAVGTTIDLLTGKDFMGDPTRSELGTFSGDLKAMAAHAIKNNMVPIWIQSVLFEDDAMQTRMANGDLNFWSSWGERLTRGLVEFFGGRAYPESVRERFKELGEAYSKNLPDELLMPGQDPKNLEWDDLNYLQRQWLEKNYPDLASYRTELSMIDDKYATTSEITYDVLHDQFEIDYKNLLNEKAEKILSGEIWFDEYKRSITWDKGYNAGTYGGLSAFLAASSFDNKAKLEQSLKKFRDENPGQRIEVWIEQNKLSEDFQEWLAENQSAEDFAYDKYMDMWANPPLDNSGEIDWDTWNKNLEEYKKTLDKPTLNYIELRLEQRFENFNDFPAAKGVEKMLYYLNREVQGYYDVPFGSKTKDGKDARLQFRADNPKVDAALVILRGLKEPQTDEAAKQIDAWLEEYGVNIEGWTTMKSAATREAEEKASKQKQTTNQTYSGYRSPFKR